MGRTATSRLKLDALDGLQSDVHPQGWLQTLERSLESVRLFPARQMDLEDHHVNWTVLRADHPGIQVRDVAALVRYHAGDGRYDSGTVCAVDREQEVRGLGRGRLRGGLRRDFPAEQRQPERTGL